MIVQSPSPTAVDFNIVATEGQTFLSGTVDQDIEENGVLVRRHSGASADNFFDLSIEPVDDPENQLSGAWIELHGDAGSLESNRVSRAADGSCTVVVGTRYVRKSITLQMVRSAGEQIDTFLGYSTGSLAKSCYDSVMTRLLPGKSKPIFSEQNHLGGVYARNPDCWAADIDLTCLSPWNSSGGGTRAGTAVSPRHIIFAAHYQITNGATVRFVAADGTVVDRTMTTKQVLPGGWASDSCIGLLDTDLPAGISFAKVPPANLMDYIPVTKYGIPLLLLDKEEKAIVRDWIPTTIHYEQTRPHLMHAPPSDATRMSFSEGITGGDSGNPTFLLVAGEAVLISTHTTAFGGPAFHGWLDEINAAMSSLGGGYQLDEIDLSAFQNYSV